MEIHWCGSTRYHDWLANDKIIPRQMLDKATEEGLIGLIDWIETGTEIKQYKVERHENSITKLWCF